MPPQPILTLPQERKLPTLCVVECMPLSMSCKVSRASWLSKLVFARLANIFWTYLLIAKVTVIKYHSLCFDKHVCPWDSVCIYLCMYVLIYLFIFLSLFLESEHACAWAEKGQREREREAQVGSALSVQSLMWGLSSQVHEIMTWAQMKSQMFNQLSHPGMPVVF